MPRDACLVVSLLDLAPVAVLWQPVPNVSPVVVFLSGMPAPQVSYWSGKFAYVPLYLTVRKVIQRSGGVVFLEQLLPILNPREGPSEYYGANGRGGDIGTTTNGVNGSIVRRLLYELKGVPEVGEHCVFNGRRIQTPRTLL